MRDLENKGMSVEMDSLLVVFIIFDIMILFLIYRFMAKKLGNKIDLVEKRQRSRWERDEAKLISAFENEEE
ncbi:MAG: hypothetical protein CMA77_02720 [Euryarchaeota archaeon]|nr:hypothetical protein [Euryarchaeota archaeon]